MKTASRQQRLEKGQLVQLELISPKNISQTQKVWVEFLQRSYGDDMCQGSLVADVTVFGSRWRKGKIIYFNVKNVKAIKCRKPRAS